MLDTCEFNNVKIIADGCVTRIGGAFWFQQVFNKTEITGCATNCLHIKKINRKFAKKCYKKKKINQKN